MSWASEIRPVGPQVLNLLIAAAGGSKAHRISLKNLAPVGLANQVSRAERRGSGAGASGSIGKVLRHSASHADSLLWHSCLIRRKPNNRHCTNLVAGSARWRCLARSHLTLEDCALTESGVQLNFRADPTSTVLGFKRVCANESCVKLLIEL